jgi:AAA domain
MNPLKTAFLVFFQPEQLESQLRQSPAARKRLLWGTLVWALIWHISFFIVFVYYSKGDRLIDSPIFILTICLVTLFAGLLFGDGFNRGFLLSFIIATYYCFTVSILGLALRSLKVSWGYQKDGDFVLGAIIEEVGASPIAFLGLSVIGALITTLRGRTRGVKGAIWLSLLAFFGVVIITYFAATFHSRITIGESEDRQAKYLIIETQDLELYFRGAYLTLSRLTHDYSYDLSYSQPTSTILKFQDTRKKVRDWYSSSFNIMHHGTINITDEDIAMLRSNKNLSKSESEGLINGLESIKKREVSQDALRLTLESRTTVDSTRPGTSIGEIVDYLWYRKPFQTNVGSLYLLGVSDYQKGNKLIETKISICTATPPTLIESCYHYARCNTTDLCVIKDGVNYSIKARNNTSRQLLWSNAQFPGGPTFKSLLLSGDRFYIQTESGYRAFNLLSGNSAWPIGDQGWFRTYITSRGSVPVLINGKIYGLSPSGYLFCLNTADGKLEFKTKVFNDAISSYWKVMLGIGGYYTCIVLVALYLGLYRLPVYTVEAILHTFCLLLTLNRLGVVYAARLSPLFFDHLSTLRLPFAKRFLQRLASVDQKLCVGRVVYLSDNTMQIKLAASFLAGFHLQHQSYLFAHLDKSLQTERRLLINMWARGLSGGHPIGELARSYERLLSQSVDLLSLEQHVANLQKFEAQSYQHAYELRLIYHILGEFLGYQQVRELAAADQPLAEILKLSYHELLNPQVVDAFKVIVETANDLKNYDIVDGFRDKQYYLSEARIKLSSISLQAHELHEPERAIFLAIVEKWEGLITAEAKALRGPAELDLAILNKNINGQDQWQAILITVSNTGQSPAENVGVTLLENENLLVREGQKSIRLLGTGESAQLEFSIYPQGNPRELRCYFDMVFDDFQRKGKLRPFADVIKFSVQTEEFRRIANPYVVGTPLQNEKVYFGRKRALNFALDNLSSGSQNNALIFFGQRRVGKSSLLYRLMDSQANAEYLFVLIDCQGFGDADTAKLLYRICQSIHSAAAKRQLVLERPDLKKFKENTFLELDAYLDMVEAALDRRKIALMFDEYEFLEYKVREGSVNPQLFNKLRNLLQHRNKTFAFIFVGTHRLTELTADYWNFLFNTALYYEIGTLGELEARALITEPVKGYLRYDELAVDKILRVTGQHPYFIQVTCRLIVNYCNQRSKSYITLTDVNDILKSAVEGSTAHVKYLFKDYATPPEQEALALLACVTDESKLSASLTEIGRAAAENQFDYDPKQLRTVLANLKNKKLVREDGYQGDLFRFEYEFLRLWIEEHVRIHRGSVTIV